MRTTVCAALLIAFVRANPLAAQVITFQVIDLGTLGGTTSRAESINNLGQVVGESRTSAGARRAFLWTPSGSNGVPTNPQMQDLGALLGDTSAIAHDINNVGQVTGTSYLDSTSNNGIAFLWTPGGTDGSQNNPQMKSLGTMGGVFSAGLGINNQGQVTGDSYTATTSSQAFVWTPGGTNGVPTNPQMRNIGTLGTGTNPQSTGLALSESGQVVGFTDAPNSSQRAFSYNNGVMTDLLTLVGDSTGLVSTATDLNSNGVIVGWSGSSNGFRAFRYENGVMSSLGEFASSFTGLFANGINEAGFIVGTEQLFQTDRRAFLHYNSNLYDLNTLIAPGNGWTLQHASGINDSNQIVGYGLLGGQQHAFLLTPVPEPTSLVMGSVVCVFSFGRCLLSRNRRMATARRTMAINL